MNLPGLDKIDSFFRPRDIDWWSIVLTIVTLFLIQQIIKRVIGHIVTRALKSHKYTTAKERKKRRDTLVSVFRSVSLVVIIIIGAIMILNQFGINVAAVAAGLGALGVVIGIAGQDLIKDFLKGIAIILFDQFRVGDIVTIAGHSGVVEQLTMQYTRLRDLDGNVHVVPNGSIDVVTNQSLGYSAVNLNVGVAYDSDMDLVIKVVNEVGQKMAKEEAWNQIIMEPIAFLRVDNFGESSIAIKALGRVIPGEQWSVAGDFRRRLKVAFEKAGIEIPFQQVVVRNPKQTSKK